MTFNELLNLLTTEAHLDMSEAINSNGCTICFDKQINITFEYHNGQLYMFSPVMHITGALSDDFFASLLQIHLFGVATSRCWFGYDAGGQRIMLFLLLDLDNLIGNQALERIEALVDQVQYWQEALPKIGQLSQPVQDTFSATTGFNRRR